MAIVDVDGSEEDQGGDVGADEQQPRRSWRLERQPTKEPRMSIARPKGPFGTTYLLSAIPWLFRSPSVDEA